MSRARGRRWTARRRSVRRCGRHVLLSLPRAAVAAAVGARAAPRALHPRPASRKIGNGSSAGGDSTSPVRTSNSEPWQGQTTTAPSRSPSESGHSSWVHVSSKATQPPSTRPRQTARPATSTRRRVPSGAPPPGRCDARLRSRSRRGLEPQRLVERGDAPVLCSVRGGVVHVGAAGHETITNQTSATTISPIVQYIATQL